MRIFLIIFLVSTSILIADIYYVEYVTKNDAKNRFVSLREILGEDDQLSFSLVKNSKGTTGCVGDKGVVEISSNGQRKSIKTYSEKLNTIHVFGDSFTFGFGVNNNETFSAFLEEYNLSYNVVNYGVPGFGLTQMYVSLLMNLKNIQRGDVVLFSPIFEDFFRDLYTPRKVLWMKTFSDLKFKKFPIYVDGIISYRDITGLKYFLASKIYLSSFLGEVARDLLGNSRGSIEASRQMLGDIRERLDQKGTVFVLAFLPTLNDEESANRLVLKNIAGHREVYDNYKAVKDRKSMFRMKCDFHYSKRGNMFIAKELTKVIEVAKL